MHVLRFVGRRLFIVVALVLGMMMVSVPAEAQSVGGVQMSDGAASVQLPNILKGVYFEQRLGSQIPLDATFTDENGKPVVLRSYFENKPVVLIMAYYRCPMLCSEVLRGAAAAFKELNFQVGDQFNVLTVSIDPEETPALAASTKRTYIKQYGDHAAAEGWHFLTGKKPEIDSLADAVGFHYKYIPQLHQYAHAAGIMVITPAGKVAQYFYGIEYRPQDLRLALVQGSHEQIGSVVDQILLYCCTYDPGTGRYHALVSRLLEIAGGATILLIGSALLFLFRWDAKRKSHGTQAA
jgi:protein SCO1/2